MSQQDMLLPATQTPARSQNTLTTGFNCHPHRRSGLPFSFVTTVSFIIIFCCFSKWIAAQELDTPILLEPDLNIVAAIRQANVDFEGLRIIDSVSDETVVLRLSWGESDQTSAKDTGTINFKSVTRVIRREDLASANRIVPSFQSTEPDLLPGSTAIQTSTAVLDSLTSGADTPIVFGISLGRPNDILASRKYYRGTVHMVAKERFPVLLDGERTMLPVVHATGTLSVGTQSGEAEFWWLDQPDNPLTLRWTFLGDTVQVVRIDRPEAGKKPRSIFKPDACRAELHGIYFDTASAVLLPASDAALDRVAKMLTEHADWSITVEGHTDSIGVDASNQTLSEQRAASVRTALIERFNVAPDRLTTRGFGEMHPIETNETLEGRARNRRVELTHGCPP